MKINEIFYSIQGEGKWTGFPNIFIRTTGCNLRCSYCDTKYAYKQGKEKTIQEITKEIKKYYCTKICITGGEPLIQKDTIELIKHLLNLKYSVIIETNGSLKIDSLKDKKKLIISLDIKTPSSKMHKKMFLQNINILTKKDQIKFIIKNKKDYEYARIIIQKFKPKCDVFFQPVWKTNSEKLAEWILEDNLKAKLGLQIHKIIWGDKKGV
jgi:7-carboxy-7-deazaguanine synthase